MRRFPHACASLILATLAASAHAQVPVADLEYSPPMFGFEFVSGAALAAPSAPGQYSPLVVFEAGKGLMPSVLTRGRLPAERVDSVVTFTGSSVRSAAAQTISPWE